MFRAHLHDFIASKLQAGQFSDPYNSPREDLLAGWTQPTNTTTIQAEPQKLHVNKT